MKKVTTGVFIALAVLSLSAFIASRVQVTRASDDAPTQTVQELPDTSAFLSDDGGVPGVTQLEGNGRAGDGDEETKKIPFVGIVLRRLPAAEAEELGIDGGVVVDKVIESAPAFGNLEAGDVITAVGGETVTKVSEVVHKVRASEAGAVLAFTVIRHGDTLDASVIVGEREVHAIKRHARAPQIRSNMLRLLRGLPEKFVRAEIVVETDDGFKTFRAVVGTPDSVDEEAGTFVLSPKDGSNPITYAISEDTLVNLKREGDLSGLNTQDTTLVVDVDGAVKLVAQGELARARLPLRGHGLVPRGPLHDVETDVRSHLRRFRARDGLREQFPRFEGLDRLPEHLRDTLPENFLDRLERLRSGEGYLDLDVDVRVKRLHDDIRGLICEEETDEGPPRRVVIRCSNEDLGDAQ